MQQGFFSMQQTCPHCRGEGEMHDPNCSLCGGGGYIKKNKTLAVKIPEGVDSGDRIRLSGVGEARKNGNGDLYIQVEVNDLKKQLASIQEKFRESISDSDNSPMKNSWVKSAKDFLKGF